MPRIGMTADNKAVSATDYPKLSLEKGERARVIALESEPLFEYVHTLRQPVMENGKVVMEEVTQYNKKVVRPKYEFVGRHICIGDYEAIKATGVDVKGCPVCRTSKETDAVQPPERRFAMHIARYQTKPGSFEVSEPFAVQIQAWAFGDKIWNTIVDLATEWGDLKKHDLMLGPCESKQYQRFDISAASKAEWLASDERKQVVAISYKENQSKDLSVFCGRKIGRELIEEDLDKVLRQNRLAFGRGPAEDTTAATGDVDVSDLLGTSASEESSTEDDGLGDLLGERVPQGTAPDKQAETQPGPVDPEGDKQAESQPGAPDQKPDAGQEYDLDDLLADV